MSILILGWLFYKTVGFIMILRGSRKEMWW